MIHFIKYNYIKILRINNINKLILSKILNLKFYYNLYYKYINKLQIKFEKYTILEKLINITNLNKLFLQELLQYKYIILNTNPNYGQYYSNLILNLLYNKFNIKTPLFKELDIQLNLYKNNILKKYIFINSTLTLKTSNLKKNNIIEHIFESYEIKPCYLVNNFISILFNKEYYYNNMYIIEIPLQDILFNLNTVILYNKSKYHIKVLKDLTSINNSTSILTTGNYSPNILLNNYFKTTEVLTTNYESSKISLNFAYYLILESISKQYYIQNIILPITFYEIIVKKMTLCIKIEFTGDTSLSNGDIISITLINIINNSYIKHGYIESYYKPIILGLTKISSFIGGVLSTISFQETLKSLSKFTLDSQLDWLLDLKSKIISSELIESGTGWFKHYI